MYTPLPYVILGNIGKLNYYLGKRASDERDEGRFPNIDFCSSPEAICANNQGEESNEDIKWIVGFFEWIERIQSYKDWDYLINLQNFVDGGSWDDSFIDAVSSIFTQGCHSSYCSSTMEVTMLKERREKFVTLLDILKYSEPMLPTNQPSSIYVKAQWAFDPAIPTTQQWQGNNPIELTPTWSLEFYGNPPTQLIPTLDGYNPTTRDWNGLVPAHLGPTAPIFWALESMQGFAPSVITTQQWEFDPSIPTTQQWNGNAPIQLTPTWALEYFGNPPTDEIPTLDGYNQTTKNFNANAPSLLAPAWKGVPPPTWVGNEFPTTIKQQGNVQSTPTTLQWDGNLPSQFASNPNGNVAGTPSLPISSDSTNTTETTSSKGIGTTNKDILIPIEDSSALPMSITAFWMKSLAIGFLNSIVWM